MPPMTPINMNAADNAGSRPPGQAERHNAILDRISGMGSVAVSEMAELLRVSEATIRRDLDHLARRRLVERTHGGALAQEGLPGLPRRGRGRVLAQHSIAAKQLAQRCAGARSIALTGAMPADLVAAQLAGSRAAVLTNSVDVAAKLVRAAGIELLVTGGICRPGTPLLVGGMAESAAAGHRVDVAVVTADAVSRSGVWMAAADAARAAAVMAGNAAQVVVACPPEGLGQDRFARVCPAEAVSEVVTWTPGASGRDADDRAIRTLQQLGVMVTVASEAGRPQEG